MDDQVPPFSWVADQGAESCRIGVHWDVSAGEMRFSCNGVSVLGCIPNVRGQGLVPVVYCSGAGTRFSCTVFPGGHDPKILQRSSVLRPPASAGGGGGSSGADVHRAMQLEMPASGGVGGGGGAGGAGNAAGTSVP